MICILARQYPLKYVYYKMYIDFFMKQMSIKKFQLTIMNLKKGIQNEMKGHE